MQRDHNPEAGRPPCPVQRIHFHKHENSSDFDHLSSTWLQHFEPCTEAEIGLVQRVIESEWALNRSSRELEDYARQLDNESSGRASWTAEQHQTFARLRRYRAEDERAFHQALRAADRMQLVIAQRQRRAEYWAEAVLRDTELSGEDREIKHKVRERLLSPMPLELRRDDDGCTCAVCVFRVALDRQRNSRELPQ